MPRTCLVCASNQRSEIEDAIIARVPFRDIARRFPVSPSSLFRHKSHAAQAIVKAQERQEIKRGFDLVAESGRVREKAWDLLGKAEAEGDTRAAIAAARLTLECKETLSGMLSRAAAQGSGPLSEFTSDELKRELDHRGDLETLKVEVVEIGKQPTLCAICKSLVEVERRTPSLSPLQTIRH